MLKAEDLRNESTDELAAMAKDLDQEIFELKCELHMSRKIEKPHLLKEKKRDRARILTILSEKRKEEEHGKK